MTPLSGRLAALGLRPVPALRLGMGLVILLLACGRVEVAPQSPAAAANVLLITIDTLRADHLGAYGAASAETPTLDRLAGEGARFELALSPAPLTLPAHASLFTGLRPPRHGVRYNGVFRLGEEAVTVAERFRDAGYATGAVIGAFVLASRFGLAQGFDHYDEEGLWRRAAPGGSLERPAAEVTRAALGWLAGERRPFFLWVHYFDPHARYAPPPPFAERFASHPYDGEIAYVDAAIGELLRGLEQRGELGRTLVVVTADHGESLGEHGETTHSFTLYDAVLHVPLLLRGPRIPRGTVVSPLVRLVDVSPTILAWAGLPPLPEPDGESVLPLLDSGSTAAERVAYAETLAPRFEHGLPGRFALRTQRELYVRGPHPELYDTVRDPRQLHDLAGSGAAADGRIAALDQALGRATQSEGLSARLEVDRETRARLHALGYALSQEGSGESTSADEGTAAGDRSSSASEPWQALRLYEAARAAFEAHELDRAAILLDRVLAALPASPSAHALRGRVALARGRPAAAVAHLREAVRGQPRSALFHSLLGDALLQSGDVEGAVRSYAEALEIDPTMAPAHVGLMWRARLGDPLEQAAAHARRAVELQPASPGLWLRIGQSWEALHQPDRALEAYRHVLKIAPGMPGVEARRRALQRASAAPPSP